MKHGHNNCGQTTRNDYYVIWPHWAPRVQLTDEKLKKLMKRCILFFLGHIFRSISLIVKATFQGHST